MARDCLSLIITYIALRLSSSSPDEKKTFGLHRLEVISALINGFLLFVYSGFMIKEGIQRIITNIWIEPDIMLIIGFIGLIVNVIVFFMLHGSHDLNIKSALLHVLGDLFSSIAVVIGAVLIKFTGFKLVDPFLGIFISLFLLISSSMIIKDAFIILLQFAPTGINIDKIIDDLMSVKGVKDVHNIHIWSLCSNITIFDSHILTDINDTDELERIKSKIKEILEKNYKIFYSTLEFEWEICDKKHKINDINHREK